MQTVINRENGVSTTVKLQSDGSLLTGTTQDCTPIVEHVQELNRTGNTGSSEMKHAASFPFVIVEKYCNDNKILFSEFMNSAEHKKRMLNDPSLSYFRIWQGRV